MTPIIDVIDDSTFQYHYGPGVAVGGFDWNLQVVLCGPVFGLFLFLSFFSNWDPIIFMLGVSLMILYQKKLAFTLVDGY